jgi:hypothetical protein
MLNFAQEPQRRIGIAPLGQPLVCETRRRQYESSYGHALDHGPFRFCATSRNGMLCKFARPRTAGSVLPNACAISSGRHPAAAIASSC